MAGVKLPLTTLDTVIELPVVNPCGALVVMAQGYPVAMEVIPALEELLVRKSRYTLLFKVVVALLGTGMATSVCGPPVMIDATVEVLTRVGALEQDIRADRFVQAKSSHDRAAARA